MLREVHESAPPSYWNEVVTLRPKDMWRSVWLQCWDETIENYATFDEVLARHAAAKAA